MRQPVTRWNPLELDRPIPPYLLGLVMFMTTCLIVGALTSSRLVYLGPLHATAGGLLFPLTYACFVVVAEVYGPAAATRLATYSVAALALTVTLVEAADHMPPTGVPGSVNAAFHLLYREDMAPVLAAVFSYVVSLTCGLVLLKLLARRSKGGLLWLRACVVPMACQLVSIAVGMPLVYASLHLQLPPSVFIGRLLYAVTYACATMPVVYVSILKLRLQERPAFLALLQQKRDSAYHEHAP